MNIDTKILSKVLPKRIQQPIMRKIHCDQLGFVPGVKGRFNTRKTISIIDHIKNKTNRSPMIISIDEEKAFDKIQHPFLLRTVKSTERNGTSHKIICSIYLKPSAGIFCEGDKLDAFPIRSGVRQECPL